MRVLPPHPFPLPGGERERVRGGKCQNPKFKINLTFVKRILPVAILQDSFKERKI